MKGLKMILNGVRKDFLRFRLNCSIAVKYLIIFLMIYLLNLLTGMKSYLWSEKSFSNEYHLKMIRINLNEINRSDPEKYLGARKYFSSNRFLISNEKLCQEKFNENEEKFSSIRLIILVKSAIENVQARQSIRLTWAKRNELEKNSIRLAFVLGFDSKNVSIENEFNQYEDIIQIDQIDSYYHNSYCLSLFSIEDKMLNMLRWINEYCRSKEDDDDLYRYVLFIDDDYYLNLKSLLKYLNEIDQNKQMKKEDRERFVTGYVYQNSRPRRFITDRWFISVEDYPYDRYPPYVTAGCFLMTKSNVNLFYLASQYLPLFRFDDIYLGLLAYSMSIQFVENNQLFSSYGSNSKSYFQHWFGQSNSSSIEPICLHGYRSNQLIQLWNDRFHANLSLLTI